MAQGIRTCGQIFNCGIALDDKQLTLETSDDEVVQLNRARSNIKIKQGQSFIPIKGQLKLS